MFKQTTPVSCSTSPLWDCETALANNVTPVSQPSAVTHFRLAKRKGFHWIIFYIKSVNQGLQNSSFELYYLAWGNPNPLMNRQIIFFSKFWILINISENFCEAKIFDWFLQGRVSWRLMFGGCHLQLKDCLRRWRSNTHISSPSASFGHPVPNMEDFLNGGCCSVRRIIRVCLLSAGKKWVLSSVSQIVISCHRLNPNVLPKI